MKDADVSRSYVTEGGIEVRRTESPLAIAECIEPIVDGLDSRLGVLLASSYEYPGRYSRWDIGFIDPPLQIVSRGRDFWIVALNARGELLLPAIAAALRRLEAVADLDAQPSRLAGALREARTHFPEEQRSRQASIFSVLRGIIGLFASAEDAHLGLYGAFGYDLAFQFDPIEFRIERPADRRDLVLFVPDELVIVDHPGRVARRCRYDFTVDGRSSAGLPREGPSRPYRGRAQVAAARDHAPGEFAALVRVAHEWFRRGDLFEVVPTQSFFEPCSDPPSEIFRRLRERNPAPYGSLMNLGEDEYLVGASPEMYLRCEGRRIETCPISGTIARGQDAISDAEQILKLLSSEKEASELTMCTDVDRNDKSRVCQPGTVRVIGRRQIEMYSRVIHTVDHVEGLLREGFDALDAFLSHTWAVTVTGAPKLWAMRFIEQHERSHRAWYGGAIGMVGFNGNVNTGLTLRTIRVKDGAAEVRAGATLLIDADPASEDQECELKAAAFLDALRRPRVRAAAPAASAAGAGSRVRLLLVDHEDSFVNTLGDYFRQTGAEVVTLRAGFTPEQLRDALQEHRIQLVVLSPGPGTPADFKVSATIAVAVELGLPVFGVCLGLQGMVEHFGGQLGVLSYPMHGKASRVKVLGGRLLAGLPESFSAGRYHSLYALRDELPAELEVTAESEDGVVMAIEHRSLPLAAVQFHPESIMTLKDGVGMRLVRNVVSVLAARAPGAPAADGVGVGGGR